MLSLSSPYLRWGSCGPMLWIFISKLLCIYFFIYLKIALEMLSFFFVMVISWKIKPLPSHLVELFRAVYRTSVWLNFDLLYPYSTALRRAPIEHVIFFCIGHNAFLWQMTFRLLFFQPVRMSTPARKRLMRDFKRLQQDPPAGISGAPQDNNIMLWNAVIFG